MAVPTMDAAITVLTESRAIDFSLPDVVVSAAVMRNALLTHSLVWAAPSDRSPTLWRVSSLLLVFAACALWTGNKKPRTVQGLKILACRPAFVGGAQACMPNQSANEDGIIIRADSSASALNPVIVANLLSVSKFSFRISIRTAI
jgi:hypothetical protein